MRIALVLLFSLATALASDKKYNFRTDFSLGRYIDGPRVTAGLLKEKGIVLLIWGYVVENPSCITLKQFQKIADEHKDDLVVIGVEHLGIAGTPKNITALLKKAGITFSIYSGCRGPLQTGYHAGVFDRDGKMIYSGIAAGDEFSASIAKAAAKAEKKAGSEEKQKSKADPKKAA
jgi:hypothetical protein